MAQIDQTMNQFCGLCMYKAMRPAGHLMLQGKQTSLTVGVLSDLFKELWSSMTWRKIWETTSQSD